MIVSCLCQNKFMDRKYGCGKRVANPMGKLGGDFLSVRCTNCGAEHRTVGKAPRVAAKSGSGGKNRFWLEAADSVRKRFSKMGRICGA
jgi:hypothetical protein